MNRILSIDRKNRVVMVEPGVTFGDLIPKLKNKGFVVTKTHFSPTGFKTDASINEIKEVFKEAKT